jgi:hypothetical protein
MRMDRHCFISYKKWPHQRWMLIIEEAVRWKELAWKPSVLSAEYVSKPKTALNVYLGAGERNGPNDACT